MTAHRHELRTCSICLETPLSWDEYKCPGCLGAFCTTCIEKWVDASTAPSCPLCRLSYESDVSPFADVHLDCPTETRRGHEHPDAAASKFAIYVLVDWLLQTRCRYVSSPSSLQTLQTYRMILDAVEAIDNLLENCALILAIEDGSEQIHAFNLHLPAMQASFTALFEAVDLALSFERVTCMFESLQW
jgi:Ring finger domain